MLTQVCEVGDSLTSGGAVGAVISIFTSNDLKCAHFTLRHYTDMLEVKR